MKLALIVAATLAVAFAAATWWALESGGVAVVETKASDGTVRSTHVWYVTPNGELWLEAGTRENAWFQDIQRNPDLILKLPGHAGRYIAEAVFGASAHDRIRSLMRAKYGFRDLWVSLIADTSRSVAVRLAPSER